MHLKHEKNLWQLLIALSPLSELSCRVAYDQISAVSVNENKHAHQLQTGLMRYMILKLDGNETRSSCDERLLFSLGASRLVDAALPRTISINKKKISSGTQGTFRVVQFPKYSPNSRCRPSSYLLVVFSMLFAIISPSSYSWNEWPVRYFCFHNQNNSISSPGLLGERRINLEESCTFDVIGWLIAKFFQIWSSVAGYGKLCVCF